MRSESFILIAEKVLLVYIKAPPHKRPRRSVSCNFLPSSVISFTKLLKFRF